MGLSSRTVLIPIVSASGEGGVLANIRISDVAPRHNPAGLNPQIADLINWRLYEAGANALGAIARMDLPHARLAMLSRLRPKSLPGYISITNGTEVAGLHAAQSRSAELGLALGLLSFAGQSRQTLFAATGALSLGDPGNGSRDNVQVLPVSHIDAKIAALRHAAESSDAKRFPARLVWFVPSETLEGERFEVQHRAALEELAETCRSKSVSLKVCAVRSLADAARQLGVSRLAPMRADKVFSYSLLGTLAASACGVGLWLWLTSPLALSFGTVTLSSGETVLSPVRARYDPQDNIYVMQDPCINANKLPVYRVDDWLIVTVAGDDADLLGDWLGGYHFTFVAISQRSGVKVLPVSSFDRGRPERALAQGRHRSLSVALPVSGPAEMTKLFVLARRGRPFDEAELRRRLKAILAGEPPEQSINAAETFLEGRAPGYVSYPFRSVEEEPECNGRRAEN